MQAKLKRRKIKTEFRSGYPVSRIPLMLSQGRALILQSEAQEILAHACKISPQPVLIYSSVPILGVTRLGFVSHPTG